MISRGDFYFQKASWCVYGSNCEDQDMKTAMKYFKLAAIKENHEPAKQLLKKNCSNYFELQALLNEIKPIESLEIMYFTGFKTGNHSLIERAALNGLLVAIRYCIDHIYRYDDEKRLFWVVRLHFKLKSVICIELTLMIKKKNYPVLFDAGQHLDFRNFYGYDDMINDVICFYRDTLRNARKSVLYFLCFCRFEAFLNRDVSKMIAKLVWKDRREFYKL